MKKYIKEALSKGQVLKFSASDSSTVEIAPGQIVEITPTKWNKIKKGNLIYCTINNSTSIYKVLKTNINNGCEVIDIDGNSLGFTKEIFGIVNPLNVSAPCTSNKYVKKNKSTKAKKSK